MKFVIEDSDKIDLHIHTDYSDGDCSVEDILIEAKKRGLEYIAFADHNRDKARFEFNKKYVLDEYGVKIVPACELDVFFNDKKVHLLAYKYNNLFTKFFLPKIQEQIFEGKVTLQKVCKIIHLCGGVAIIAHPFKYRYDTKKLIEDLVEDNSIDGIECIHSYHTQEEINYLLDICNKNNLIVGAGSDFHFEGKKTRKIYTQDSIGELAVTNSKIEDQLQRAKEKYPKIKR